MAEDINLKGKLHGINRDGKLTRNEQRRFDKKFGHAGHGKNPHSNRYEVLKERRVSPTPEWWKAYFAEPELIGED